MGGASVIAAHGHSSVQSVGSSVIHNKPPTDTSNQLLIQHSQNVQYNEYRISFKQVFTSTSNLLFPIFYI